MWHFHKYCITDPVLGPELYEKFRIPPQEQIIDIAYPGYFSIRIQTQVNCEPKTEQAYGRKKNFPQVRIRISDPKLDTGNGFQTPIKSELTSSRETTTHSSIPDHSYGIYYRRRGNGPRYLSFSICLLTSYYQR